MKNNFGFYLIFSLFLLQCSTDITQTPDEGASTNEIYPNVVAAFGDHLDLNHLSNYANQTIPTYITKFNDANQPISDKGATLGRVLFYDTNLSRNNSISCSSCHKQAYAFSDEAISSTGVSGTTARHSMRLVNSRFSIENKFFWDERAANLETQTTMPIKDHGEMGFSGSSGDPDFNTLLSKLSNIGYYKDLFKFVYGTSDITEIKIQLALSQFIRSIQSFDSKYDAGRLSANDNQNFSNFTAQENMGKNLYLTPPVFDAQSNRIGGGLGCAGCHALPEADIDPNTRNNGIIGTISGATIDITNTRAPSLRNLTRPDGSVNGPMMHTGNLTTLQNVLGHYGTINVAVGNTNLDPRLRPNGIGQKLNLSSTEVNAVIAFIKTLSGSDVYVNSKWSNPFP